MKPFSFEDASVMPFHGDEPVLCLYADHESEVSRLRQELEAAKRADVEWQDRMRVAIVDSAKLHSDLSAQAAVSQGLREALLASKAYVERADKIFRDSSGYGEHFRIPPELIGIDAALSLPLTKAEQRVKALEEVAKEAKKHQDVYSNISKEEEYGGDESLEKAAADAYNSLHDALAALDKVEEE